MRRKIDSVDAGALDPRLWSYMSLSSQNFNLAENHHLGLVFSIIETVTDCCIINLNICWAAQHIFVTSWCDTAFHLDRSSKLRRDDIVLTADVGVRRIYVYAYYYLPDSFLVTVIHMGWIWQEAYDLLGLTRWYVEKRSCGAHSRVYKAL